MKLRMKILEIRLVKAFVLVTVPFLSAVFASTVESVSATKIILKALFAAVKHIDKYCVC